MTQAAFSLPSRALVRRQRERALCVILLLVGIVVLHAGGASASGLTTPAPTVRAASPSMWQGTAQGVLDVQPIPTTSLPACGNAITIPLGPSICVDPGYWVIHGLVGLFNWFVNWVIALFTGFIQSMVAHDLLFDTPTSVTTGNAAITTLFGDMVTVANGALALIVLIAGFNLLMGTQVGLRQTEAKELLPRLVLGVFGANLAFWFISQAVDGTNQFMHAVVSAPFAFFVPDLSTLPPGVNTLYIGFFGVLGIIVYEILFLLLIFQIFTRLALLDFLIILAPLAIVCWILPQTRRAAEWWLSLLCSTLILQPLQLLMVAMGLTLVANINTHEGVWGIVTILLQIGLLIATLYLTVRLPALLNYGLFRTVGAVGNPIGMVLDLATTIAGFALAGAAGGAGAAAAGGGGAAAAGGGAVSGGGPPPAPQLPGGGGGGGGGTPGLPSPGGQASGGGGTDDDFGGSSGSGATAADDPRPGAGTVIDTTGWTIPDDAGEL